MNLEVVNTEKITPSLYYDSFKFLILKKDTINVLKFLTPKKGLLKLLTLKKGCITSLRLLKVLILKNDSITFMTVKVFKNNSSIESDW